MLVTKARSWMARAPSPTASAKSLVREDGDTVYGLVWTTLRRNKDDPRILKLIGIYRSPEVKAYILDTFKGSIIPSW